MGKSNVYFLPMADVKKVGDLIAKAAGEFYNKDEFVAIKLHFGEKGNKGFIRPEWVRPVVDFVKTKKAIPFLTDTNTIYHGQRADAVHHLMLAKGHGFKIEKVGAPVVIADGLRGNDYVEVKIEGSHYKSVKVAKGIYESHAMIVLSHTKGHMLTGFGGALKNLGMGCTPRSAKYDMHAGTYPTLVSKYCIGCGECLGSCGQGALSLVGDKISLDQDLCVGCGECIVACPHKAIDIPWRATADAVQQKLVEHACGAVKDKPVCYVNYMHCITRNCDCMPSDPEGPFLDNVGILISTDPVAIDQASIDIINDEAGKDLFREMNDIEYSIQLDRAAELGMGSREYELIR